MTTDEISRWIVAAIMALSSVLYVVHRLRSRSPAAEQPEAWPWQVGRALGALVIFGPVVIYVFRPAWLGPRLLPLPWGMQFGLGGLCAAIGLGWLHAALGSLGGQLASTTRSTVGQTLVTTGAYYYVRHPLYAASWWLLFSCALLSAHALLLVNAALLWGLLAGVLIPEEERHLAAKFGEEFLAYRRRTGALWPRWRQVG